MSRVSQKSGLSPSITKGSQGIDLGKNSGVDMGQKSQPSVTSGGIGVTQEVTSVGGASVSAGVNVDVTPVDFAISVNPNEGTLSVATGAEIPGGLLGISGGIEVDTNTGRIIGGSVGGEVGGFGINVSNSEKGGLGIEFTYQIPGTPIELSLGFGFPPQPKPTPTPPGTPTPTPIPTPGIEIPPPGAIKGFKSNEPETWPEFKEECFYKIIILAHSNNHSWIERVGFHGGWAGGYTFKRFVFNGGQRGFYLGYNSLGEPTLLKTDKVGTCRFYGNISGTMDVAVGNVGPPGDEGGGGNPFNSIAPKEDVQTFAYGRVDVYSGKSGSQVKASLSAWLREAGLNQPAIKVEFVPEQSCGGEPYVPILPEGSNQSPSPLALFPNPPPRRNRKMDACCRETLAFLRAIYTKLGLAKFPGNLPSTIIQEVPKEGEEPAEPPQVPIADLTALLMWQFERDDERWGQWQVQIDIKDSDITKEGDQKKSIKLPNLAESIAEFEGQLLSIMTNVDALVAMQVKTLAESGMARQEAIKGYLASKAIIKYMAFKSSEVDVPVPMTFTAGAETISELLKESEGHIKGTDYTEKETLRDVYLDLLQAAAITRAVHWQRINTKTDTKSQLLSILKGSVDLAASIAKPQNPNGEGNEKTFDPEKNFEDFIDSVEDGFRNTTGITNIQNPYGKPPSQRPRIRQIGDNISQAGGSD